MFKLEVTRFQNGAFSPGFRRHSVVFRSEHRFFVFTLSGGMMDIGWAGEAMREFMPIGESWVAEPAGAFRASASQLMARLRQQLTRVEQDEQLLCSAEFVALEIGAADVALARLGSIQVLSNGERVGDEEVLPTMKQVSMGTLCSDVRWSAEPGLAHLVLTDQYELAETAAKTFRFESVPLSRLLLISHPMWAEPKFRPLTLQRLVDQAGKGAFFISLEPVTDG